MTLWEKKYKRESQRQCFFANFQVCPLVEVSSAFLKKCDHGVEDNPFISLNNSSKSVLFLLSPVTAFSRVASGINRIIPNLF